MLKNIYTLKYLLYINSLPVSKKVKEKLSDQKFIDKNPPFYLYYPLLFSSAFEVEKQQVDKICIAGYLYYISNLLMDSVVDDKNTSALYEAIICQEESIKLLTSVFGLDSKFWKYWNLRKGEYFKAIQIEKEIKKSKTNSISFDEYKNLASLKSSFGMVAIDVNFLLSKSEQEHFYEAIINSHKLFSISFQLKDDLLDVKEDFNRDQFNWVSFSYFNQTKNDGVDIELANKLIYIDGHAKEILNTCIDYLLKAKEEIKGINLPHWNDLIENEIRSIQSTIREIDEYIEILSVESNLSHNLLTNNNEAAAISKAINFIKINQKEDGSWHEFITQEGISNVWATSFVVSHLSCKELQSIFREQLDLALKFLRKEECDYLWGYSSKWIPDADSTSFTFLAFMNNNIDISEASMKKWLSYQEKNGGFKTYNNDTLLLKHLNETDVSNISYWLKPYYCVSAVAFYYLIKSGKKELKNYKVLKNYLEKAILKDEVQSYWWTSPIYSYYYLALSYEILGDENILNKIVCELVNMQNADGSFGDFFGKNLFYTALGLEILLIKSNDYQEQIENAASYLLQSQFEDGSWNNSYALQLPSPVRSLVSNTNFKISSKGTNVRAKEFNRLFTTVAVVRALVKYEKKQSYSSPSQEYNIS